ncbi:MAG: MBL fold metallo-hydrolase [Methanomassiliicoccales archaeon]
MTFITFLGTGGGRFATIYQARSTGGIYIDDGARFHVDPGPGAIVAMKRLSIDPAKTDAILVSHCHLDHYSDAEILIEGMTCGGFGRRGYLLASKSVIEGEGRFGPAISRYHLSMVKNVKTVKPRDEIPVGDVTVEVTPTKHSDPTTVGFRFHTSSGIISYVSDTEIDKKVIEFHRGCRILVLCVTRPLGSRITYHLNTEDAAEFVKLIRPEIAILTHFGMKVLDDGPEKQAEYIERESGVLTRAMSDYASIDVQREIEVRY